jgi:hypothetical protein
MYPFTSSQATDASYVPKQRHSRADLLVRYNLRITNKNLAPRDGKEKKYSKTAI